MGIILGKFKRSKFVFKIYEIIFRILSLLPVKKGLVMFESFYGKQYSCNPRAIYEYMSESKLVFDMRWSAHQRHTKTFRNKELLYIKRLSFKWLLYMARSEYWICNSRLPLWLPKPKHTTYIQTWHGTPLKKLGLDISEVHMPGTTTEQYKSDFLRSTNKWDYLVSPNQYSTEIFRRAFGYDRTIIESGYPRNDFLVNNNNQQCINNLKTKLGLPLDKKIILYAPTWRDNDFYDVGKYKFNMPLDIQAMEEELASNYVVLLRMHYLVDENININPYKGFAYNFSDFEDIRELYLVSDLLVTDYSSVFFDYAVLRRPILFYAYDIDIYRNKLRGFYFDFEEKVPGPISTSTEELIEDISALENLYYGDDEKFVQFYNKFCSLENGESSKEVANILYKS